MNRKLRSLTRPATLAAAVAMALSLAACNRPNEADKPTVASEQTQPSTQRSADTAMERAGANVQQAGRDIGDAAHNAADATQNAAAEATDKVGDASITASVNADLAKDPDLSALKIDVDTTNGHVTLHGTAPSAEAKQRATQLASNVKGVSSVDNQLEVQK